MTYLFSLPLFQFQIESLIACGGHLAELREHIQVIKEILLFSYFAVSHED